MTIAGFKGATRNGRRRGPLRVRSGGFASLLAVLLAAPPVLLAKTNYKKWLDEEVVWIISSKERTAFLALRTDQEKDEFIRKFWERRDPTPSTPRNEYKEEHYRRFEYALKHFQEGTPGWKTDRGKTYIIHGPPVREEFFTSNSKMDLEGRGEYRSRTPNTIVWTYHGDPNARYYRGEIALVFQPVGGMSRQNFALGESKTAQDKADELNRQFGEATDQTSMESDTRYRLTLAGPPSLVTARGADIPSAGLGESEQYKDDLFRSPGEVLEENLAKAEARESARQKLREAIATHLSFGNLPVTLSSFSYLQADGNYRVQVKVDIPRSELARHLDAEGQGKDESRIDLYCALINPMGGVVDEFVDSALVPPSILKSDASSNLHYWNTFTVPAGDYILKTAIRSATSERLGFGQAKLALKSSRGSSLQMSDVLLTNRVEQVAANSGPSIEGNAVTFGDVRFLSSPEMEFANSSTLFVFLQILLPKGKTVDDCDLSLGMNFISGQSIVKRLEPRKIAETNSTVSDVINFATSLQLADFPRGEYTLQIQVIDHKAREFSIQRASFSVR